MSADSWVSSSGGSWSVASNWSLGRAPRSSDSVIIGVPGTFSLTASVTVAGLTMSAATTWLGLGGWSFGVTGVATLGSLSVDGPGTLTTSGVTAVTAGVTLGGGVVWVNAGTVNDAGTIGLGDLSGVTGTLVNQAGAVFDFTAATAAILDDGVTNAGGTFTLGGGVFTNAGTLEQTGGGGDDLIYAAVTNTGVITATSGTLELAGGGVLGGAMGGSGAGLVALGAGVFTLGGSSVSLTGGLGLVGGEIVLASGQTLSLGGSVLLGEAIVGGGAVDGPGTLVTTGAITVVADGSPQIMLGDGVTWLNAGSLSDGGDISIGDLSGNLATLVNAAGGTINFVDDTGEILDDGYLDAAGYYHQGSSTLANAGVIEKTGGTGRSEIDAVLSNTGTVTVSSGTLALHGGGVLGGTMGAIGSGILELGTTTFAGAAWALGGTHQTISGAMALTGGGVALAVGQTLSLTGTADLAGGEVFGPGTLSTTGVAEVAGVTLNDALNWRNSGTLEMLGAAIFADAASTLFNLAGGVMLFAGDGGDIFDRGQLSNAGLIEKTAGTGTDYVTAVLLGNSGSIIATSGTLAFDGGGVLQGVISGTGAGVVALGGGVFTLSDPSLPVGVMALAGGTLTLKGGQTFDLAAGGLFDGGSVDGAGTLQTAGNVAASALTLGGGVVWLNTWTATLSGALSEGDGSGAVATIINQAGASLVLAGDAAGFGADALATLDNAGTLEKSAGSATSQVGVVLDSTGSLEIISGSLALQDGFSLAGSVGGAGTLALAGGAGGLAAGLVLGEAGLVVDGAAVSVAGNLSTAAGFALSSGELEIGAGKTLTLSGNVVLGGGTLDGPGTLLTTFSVSLPLAVDAALTVAGVWIIDGVASQAGELVLGDSESAGTLVNQGTLLFTTATAGISSSPTNGTGLVVNRGLLSDVAANGTAEIAAELVSSGTLNVGGGAVVLDDGGILSGGVIGAGTLALDGGTTTLIAGTGLAIGDLLVNGGALVVDADVADPNWVSLAVGSLWLAAGETLSLGLTLFPLISEGTFAVDGPGTLALSSAASLFGTAGALSTGGGAVWLNEGVWYVAAPVVGADPAGAAATGASFVNAAGALMLLTADAGGLYAAPGAFSLTNEGVVEKSAGSGISAIDAFVTNTGTIVALSGTLALDDGGVLAGELSGDGGLVVLGGGDFTVAPGGVTVSGSVGLTGATLTLASGQMVTWSGPSVLDGGSVDGPGTLILSGASGLGAADQVTVGGGGTLENAGTLVVSGTLGVGDPSGGLGTVRNLAGGVLDLTNGAAVLANFGVFSGSSASGTLLNQGTLEVTGGSATVGISVINSGTILASGGTLVVSAGLNSSLGTLAMTGGATLQVSQFSGSAGSILVGSGGGTLDTSLSFAVLTANLILDGLGSSLLLAGGADIEQTLTGIGESGVLNLAAGRSYRTALALNDDGLLVLGGGTLSTGGFSVGSGGRLVGFGTVIGPIANQGTIEASFGLLQLTGNANGMLQIDPTGTLALAGSVSGDVNFAASGGTLELVAGGGVIGTLSGLAAGDTILLEGVASASVVLTGAELTITSSAGIWTAALADDPAATSLRVITSDPVASTMITFATAQPSAADDFTGSGASDLLLRNSNGMLAVWDVAGLSSGGGAVLGNPGTAWQVAGVGDFTGGGSDDVLLQTSAGFVELWELQGDAPVATPSVNAPGVGWSVAATGDFNGDGRSDIVWQNTSGAVDVWEMNGPVPITTALLGSPGNGWLVSGVVNLGTTGSNEILMTNSAGAVGLWQVNGLTPGSFTNIGSPGSGWHLAGAASVGGDGLATLVWQNAADEVAVWEIGGAGPIAAGILANPGSGWVVAGIGSNGAGGLEVMLENPQGSVMALTASGTSLTGSAVLGTPGPTWTVVNR